MPRLFRSPRFWLAGFSLWLALLYLMSSFPKVNDYSPPIHHFDKIAHFGYFFGGGGLFCAYLFRRNPADPMAWKPFVLKVIFVIAIVGLLDEFHQSFTPGRSGNDLFDWFADVLGGVAATIVFKRFHDLLK